MMLLIFSQCENPENIEAEKKGAVVFNISPLGNQSGKLKSSMEPESVMISIKNEEGDYVLQNEILQLHAFGSGHVSQSAELSVAAGNATSMYYLTEFLVLNADNDVIYAAPVAGSEYSDDVMNPLPLALAISEGQPEHIIVDVVAVGEFDDPASFGYVNFSFNIVEPEPIPNNELRVNFVGNQDQVYDSVKATFTNSNNEIISKKLSLQTVGEKMIGKAPFTKDEINDGMWNLIVSAFHSPYVNEQITIKEDRTVVEVLVSPTSSEMAVSDDMAIIDNVAHSSITLTYKHLMDLAGVMHVIVNHEDICASAVEYTINDDVEYLYIDKYFYDGTTVTDYRFIELFSVEAGSYEEVQAFESMCDAETSEDTFYDLLVYVKTIDGTVYYVYSISNEDPNPWGRSSKKSIDINERRHK